MRYFRVTPKHCRQQNKKGRAFARPLLYRAIAKLLHNLLATDDVNTLREVLEVAHRIGYLHTVDGVNSLVVAYDNGVVDAVGKTLGKCYGESTGFFRVGNFSNYVTRTRSYPFFFVGEDNLVVGEDTYVSGERLTEDSSPETVLLLALVAVLNRREVACPCGE